MLGISVLILSLGHTPLPKADYHNIRHHDGPGERCRLHEHLLRWHPNAANAQDVAVLHWHWFLPTSGVPGGSSDDQAPAWLGLLPDWSGLTWDSASQLPAPTVSRFLGRSPLGPNALAVLEPVPASLSGLTRASPYSSLALSALIARSSPLNSLLSRWIC